MATQMPIPPDFNRFIGPQAEQEDESQEPSVFEMLDDTESDVEELADGSAIVRMESNLQGPDEDPDFYENLAERISNVELKKISLKYLDLIEKDKEAREERDKQYEEGLRRTGLGKIGRAHV